MILNTAPANTALLSNVGSTGEFRIRNSAKAFNILSSGLYANKIRAIVRELGCNAVDSHKAAGREATPFDLHLPTQLEPWFAIRDYGVGLTHEQVVSIYTTYFESTKTDSNDFIGALGLGSKSPFSYTDNFTVTAIRDGVRGVYTAYINDGGIPSIALMMQEPTLEPTGVEVRFAVSSFSDFSKFQQEARHVLTHFPVRPVVNVQDFKPVEFSYRSRDIIPGVHHLSNDVRSSTAVMGMIAYPIVVPNPEQNLGDLARLLTCGLELHFGIGELDFQASREGLSYVPQTIEAIRKKLSLLNDALYTVLKSQADAEACLWTRALMLNERLNDNLWSAAARLYVTNTRFDLIDLSSLYSNKLHRWTLTEEDLAAKYNAKITAFSKANHELTCGPLKPTKITIKDPTQTTGQRQTLAHSITVSRDAYFVEVDTKLGALERTKYHWRENSKDFARFSHVYVIGPADRKQPVKFKKLMQDLQNPPQAQQFKASALSSKDRDSRSWGQASVLRLAERHRRHSSDWVWESAGTASTFDAAKTFYYVEMDGWNPVGLPSHNIKDFYQTLKRAGLFSGTIHGVRRKDIDLVKQQSNWINLNDHVKSQLSKIDLGNVMGLVKEAIDFRNLFKYASDQINSTSPYYQLWAEFKNVTDTDYYRRSAIEEVVRMYGIKVNQVDSGKLIADYKAKADALRQRYPMLQHLASYGVPSKVVADYIYMIDNA